LVTTFDRGQLDDSFLSHSAPETAHNDLGDAGPSGTPRAIPIGNIDKEACMPRGDKSSYTSKQKRQAEHIESGYKRRGLSTAEAERRAWATVNKETGGGKKRAAKRKRTSGTSRGTKGTSRRRTSSRKK